MLIATVKNLVVNYMDSGVLSREILFHQILKMRILVVSHYVDIPDKWCVTENGGDTVVDFAYAHITDISGHVIERQLASFLEGKAFPPMLRIISVHPGNNGVNRVCAHIVKVLVKIVYRYAEVAVSFFRASSSGVPAKTREPPLSPAPGPSSISQSAHLITSRLCSTTTTV